MVGLRALFGDEIRRLHRALSSNEKAQEDITSLFNFLHCGTSIVESRRSVRQQAIEVVQGYNVRILTLVTIFFLPMVFVATVFGMRNTPTTIRSPTSALLWQLCVDPPTHSFLP